MIEWWWSYILFTFPLATTYLAGRKRRSAWSIGLLGIAVWNMYAWTTDQLGFIVINFIFLGVYIKNWMAWNDTTWKGG
jgi:hypothetical protein